MKPQLLYLFLCLFATTANAQLICNFEADTTKHCAPKRITFTDLSSGGGNIVYRYWTFGNGGISNSNDPNPSRLYPNAGLYTVTLTVSDGVDTASLTKTAYIEIFDNPTPDFSMTTTTNCLPRGVSFTDLTAAGSAPIQTWSWDFGDLSPLGTTQNPSHSYTNNGTYSVLLTVTDTNGCQATVNKANLVHVSTPKANFTSSGATANCNPPLTVNFTNTSNGGSGALTYHWNFGNGSTSSAQSPSHTYNSGGIYDVWLAVTDTAGCTDTIRKDDYVSITSTTASFSLPDTLCISSYNTISNTSLGASTYSWDFGNSQTSTANEPIVRYTTKGTYTIRLIASSGPTCVDTATKTIYVEEIVAAFGIDPDYSCETPMTVTLNDSSIGNITSWKWDWKEDPTITTGHNGTFSGTSTQQNVTFQLRASTSPKIQKLKFTPTLIVTSSAGCSDTLSKVQAIEMYVPDVFIIADSVVEGCVPLTITFSDTVDSKEPVVSYSWDFDRNSVDTSDLKGPHVITYTQPGVYDVQLRIVNDSGCTALGQLQIRAGTMPDAKFLIQKDTLCPQDSITFTNLTVDTVGLDWAWDFGDGTGSGEEHPTKQFDKETGIFDIKLTASHYGCESDFQVDSMIYMPGPIVDLSTSVDCSNPSMVTVNVTKLNGATKWWFDYGDTLGGGDTNQVLTTYVYQGPGQYFVNIIAVNDSFGCVNSEKARADITGLKAVISFSDSVGCTPFTPWIRGDSSVGVMIPRYNWELGNGEVDFFTPVVKLAKSKYTTGGTYTVTLVVTDVNGCKDTTSRDLTALEVHAGYTRVPDIVCDADSVTLVDTSLSIFPIEHSIWRYWNNTYDTITALKNWYAYNDTSAKIPAAVHKQFVTMTLISIDTFGCMDSADVAIPIRQLQTKPIVEDSTLCEGDTIFVGDSLAATGFIHSWDWGDGSSDTAYFPFHTYQNPGIYELVHRIVDSLGCELLDTLHHISMDHIRDVGFWATPRDSSCYPMSAFFFDTSDADRIKTRYWLFDQNGFVVQSVKADSNRKIYTEPGLYDVKLVIETQNGCRDSMLYPEYISVSGPYAAYYHFPDSACIGDSINFVIDSMKNVGTFDWDFGDGFFALTGDTLDTVKHAYNQAGTYNAIVLYTDTLGTCSQFEFFNLSINEVVAGISLLGDSIGCPPFVPQLADSTLNGNQWFWTVGGMMVSGDSLAQPILSDPGDHVIRLDVGNDITGCADSAFITLSVWPNPDTLPLPDTTICVGDSIGIAVDTGFTYLWSGDGYISDTTNHSIVYYNDEAGKLQLEISDNNGCRSLSRGIVNIQFVPKLRVWEDTTLIIGEWVELASWSNQEVFRRWYPDSGLSCIDCENPRAIAFNTTTYCLEIQDLLRCFTVDSCILIDVEKKYSLDVPTTFTPNGDGINDVIYVKGWGLKELLEWKIYNRWGQLIYESSDLEAGWDGTYKGEPQNIESYAFTVRALAYNGEEITKKGFISLVR